MFSAEQQAVEKQIRAFCAAEGLPQPRALEWKPIPFSGEWGISTSFFQLAADEVRMRAARSQPHPPVPQFAQETAASIAAAVGVPPGFTRVEAIKGYLNLYFSTPDYSSRVIDTVLENGKNYGVGEARGEIIMVEFSQPNTHKAFHVGHLRSAILGDVICRILEGAGYGVVRANYYGDIGLHVIRWLWNYMKYHAGEKPPADTTRWMGELYAEATRRLEDHPDLEAEVREVYARWDRQEPEVVAVWKETRQWSLDGFAQLYEVLDIRFDRDYSNSEAEAPGKRIVEELIQRGIAEDERPDGPVIVRIDEKLGLKKEKYRVLVVLRSDNTALYSTEDLGLAVMKFEEYDLARSLYVVDVRQSLHFQQVFKTLEIAGYPWADRCQHIPYELVSLPGNVVMASREGTVVLLEDLIREAVGRALEIVDKKNPELGVEQKEVVSRAVGIGAIKYSMLARDNTKIATFDWETALNFEGQAAPYIQYAHVRANSILRRMGGSLPSRTIPEHDLDPTEIELIDLISRYPGEIRRAAEEYKPLHLTNMAYDLARAFSDFYNQCPVLKAEPNVRDFRLRLVAAARQTIANNLAAIGIAAPEVM